MQNLTKKRSFLLSLFLLMAIHHVYAAKSVYQPSIQPQKVADTASLPRAKRKLLVHGYCRAYNIPTDIFLLITYFVHDNPLQYKNKPLPNDLSEQDLSGYDFTGCQFTYTNLTDTNLEGVILTNTTCDYQKVFQNNIKKNKLQGGNWYQNSLAKDLKSIAAVYPKLKSDVHKAKLLAIAAGLAWLPFYEDIEFYIKMEYWPSELLQLKQVLGNPYGGQLVCSLENYLKWDAKDYCWTTNYPRDKVNIKTPTPHTDFDKYLKDFKDGLTKCQCKSKKSLGFAWYKDNIIQNIEGLKKVYPKIKEVAAATGGM